MEQRYLLHLFYDHFDGSRDGAMVRAFASHQCVPGSIPGPGDICGLSLLLVLFLAPRVFLRLLRFSPLLKNQHFRSGIVKHFIMRLRLGWLRKHSLCLTLNLHFVFTICINNSFIMTLCPPNAWNRIFGKVQFQKFSGKLIPDPLRLATRGSRLLSCYALLVAYENPDQISGNHGARVDCTMAASFTCKSAS